MRLRPPVVVAIALTQALLLLSPATASGPNIYTVAGTGAGADTGDGDQATEADIRLPRSVFPLAAGGYVFAEPFSHVVRLVNVDGIIATVAGDGTAGFAGDGGQASAARLNFVHGASPTSDGGLLLADTLNHRIRKVSATGVITTVAGTGVAGYSGDAGPATSAQINNPRGVAALAGGGFLIPDTNNHRIRRVSPEGTITTVAGTGIPGFSGEGGQAVAARLSLPFGVAPMADGGFLVVDTGNERIRRVSNGGTITTMAGNGQSGYEGDGLAATSTALNKPHNVAVQSDGGVLIADRSNERVRRVDGASFISTVAGTGMAGFGGDGGPAAAAAVNGPKAVTEISGGGILIADETNDRIRFVGSPVAPANTILPAVAAPPRIGRSVAAFAGGWTGTGPLISYHWLQCPRRGKASCTDIAGAVGKAYTPVPADVGSTLAVMVVASNAAGSAAAVSARSLIVR
ncbi:MAG: hypothetical protein ACRD0Q_04920 [Acidimicrobiales bacterium]